MRTILKTVFILLLAIVLMAVPCFAAAGNGTVTITLKDKEQNDIDGMRVHLCQIAELNTTGYYPTAAFDGSGISIAGIINNPNAATAETLADYVRENGIETVADVSEHGGVSFSALPLGIWLVYGDENSSYTFNPYLVFLPYESGGTLHYDVSSAPKVEESSPDETSLYVFKKWDDRDNAAKKRPDAITVELLNGETVVASAQLNEANGWSHTFDGVEAEGAYSVREKSVPDYQTSYSGDAVNGFVITNTYAGEKLPQTGQYWWPIGIIAVAGICFVLLGIYEMGAKKHGKKK